MLNAPPSSRVWPAAFTLPARPVVINAALLYRLDDALVLYLRMTVYGASRRETLIGNSLIDLLFELTSKLGFTASDAACIVNLADQGEPEPASN